MIRAKKLDQAQEYLAKIPVDSPQRGTRRAEDGPGAVGQLSGDSKQIRDWENGEQPLPEGTDLEARKQELESLKAKARKTLEDGVERMRKSGETSKVLATAVLIAGSDLCRYGRGRESGRSCWKTPKSAC